MGNGKSKNCQGGPNVVKCPKYQRDLPSAARKATSNVSVNVPFVSKQITGPHNKKTDSYNTCKNCGKHKNYHTPKATKEHDTKSIAAGRALLFPLGR